MELKRKTILPPSDLPGVIHLLGDILGQVITELESSVVFDIEEQIRYASKERRAGATTAGKTLTELVTGLTPENARAVASAFTLYFDLVNLAAENDRVRTLINEERQHYPDPVPDSIANAIALCRQNGVSHDKMLSLLNNLSIELVLTAHPTEAKRRTILTKLQRIAENLFKLQQVGLRPEQTNEAIAALHADITSLWLTDRSRKMSPAVTDEVRTGLFFIGEVFWPLLPRIYKKLTHSLNSWYPGLNARNDWLRLASWIGGDRDGNPNVTSEITAETLRLHRGLAVEKHRAALRNLSRHLSISSRRLPPPETLIRWIDSQRPFPSHASYIDSRYKDEPYRVALSLLAENLGLASQDNMIANLFSTEPHEARIYADELNSLLTTITEALPEALAQSEPLNLLCQIQIFGLHSARLHLREDAVKFSVALSELLAGLGIEEHYNVMDEGEKFALLSDLLERKPPDLTEYKAITPVTAEILSMFQLAAKAELIYGGNITGPLIISMTRSAVDVMTVLVLTRWTGCIDCLSVVPLFETIENLEKAPAILTKLFTSAVYRKHLLRRNNRQTVMIGYSDTNKIGGYLAANWALYRAQEEITQVCSDYGVVLTLFHGRGGSTARGGGPANQAIRSQPPGTVNGRFYLTEQGEVISAQYSNPFLAERHIEEIVQAVILSSFAETSTFKPVKAVWRQIMMKMSAAALEAYQSLIYGTPGFYDFWQAATPIDEIKRLRIGSRPTERKFAQDSMQNTRAIPWVFSWMQGRFNLPGWYGLGQGLQSQKDSQVLKEMYAHWPFFKTLIHNTEMSLLIADMEIARMYASLVPDKVLADSIYKVILDEYKRTENAILTITGNQALLDGDPQMKHSIQLRNPYADPLNYIQVEMLRRLRALPDPEGVEAERIREVIVITINGIASGLRNTG